jgi:hypothetical protein
MELLSKGSHEHGLPETVDALNVNGIVGGIQPRNVSEQLKYRRSEQLRIARHR